MRAYRTAAVLDSSQEFQRYLITTGIPGISFEGVFVSSYKFRTSLYFVLNFGDEIKIRKWEGHGGWQLRI